MKKSYNKLSFFVVLMGITYHLHAQQVYVQSQDNLSDKAVEAYIYNNQATSYGGYFWNSGSDAYAKSGITATTYNDGTGNSYGVYGYNNSYGTGTPYAGYFYGSYSSNASTGYGIYARSSNASSVNYGIYSTATGSAAINYGIYATASGAATNYAAYFNGITRLDGGTDVGAASGGDVVIGNFAGQNIGMDNNEIQARNDSVVSTLYLNWDGGNIQMGDGNVSIGKIAALRDLHIKQKVANVAIRTEHQTDADYWETGIGTSTKNYKFYYNGAIKADIASADGAYLQSSDRRLKTDIEPLGNTLEKIMQLKPATYYYTDSKEFATSKSVGFIAQEVEQVFPQSVRDVDNGYKGVVYDHFAVYAIAAIQELNGKLETKTSENEDLKKELTDVKNEITELRAMLQKMSSAMQNCCLSEKVDDISTATLNNSGARLEQNAPNPFYNKTIIQYYLPEDTRNANLQIVNIEGKVVKTISLDTTGYGTTTINGNDLAAGTYVYSLVINGKVSASKEMILTK
ncbi:MAG: tail fiber domain-containing protein [Chitinophagales bacterium]|nr:tail fiber domain-containing protein [Bacteroidota bacterium]MCB9042297.1 tail fiber domain-containing protein [Chitinophagales bacterium]